MTTDFRALCADLIASWDADGCDWKPQHQARWEATVARARAALGKDEPAVPEDREPVSVTGRFTFPADGEVAELVAWLRANALTVKKASGNPANGARQRMNRAADLLQQRHPEPVPVSERLPGPSDCAPWPKDSDASDWCWVGTDEDGGWNWEQRSAGCLAMFPDDFTHWLSAHALPIPQQQENTNDH